MTENTRSRLEKIARRVRIMSMTRCDFDGKHLEAPPPLPRRYPPLPLIERMQPELYAHAYCTPLGASRDAEQGADMLAALSAANASRTRIDPDWIVHEVDTTGAITVSKRGTVRRIPSTEIFQEPNAPKAPPQPGRLTSIVLPREHPNEGGFYFAFGETVDATMEGRPMLRFYWNVSASDAPRLMRSLTATLNARGVPFAYKCARNPAGYARADAATLYIYTRWLGQARAAIDDIHRTLGSTLREDAPLFALRLAPGLGFAEDPGTGDSFGMARSRLLAEALWVAFARSAKSAARVMEEIEAYFLQNGIELDRAHLNPWSVDRFEMRLL